MLQRVLFFAVIIALLLQQTLWTSSIKDVSLRNLFQEADLVAVIQVTSADAESFDGAVYKAQILRSFKGSVDNTTIFFGPHVSYRIGSEYVVFLKSTGKSQGSLLKNGPNPWASREKEPYYAVMYAGYSILPVEYTCLLPGCDYGVSVPSSQVHLPGVLKAVRHRCQPGSNYDSWVGKAALLEVLEDFAKRPK